MKKVLDVPYLSQFKDLSDVDWQEKACGVVCLAMVIAFYEKKERSIKDFIELGLKLNAYSEEQDGWIHSGLCRIANVYGYNSWRRKWALSEGDIENFKEEGRTKLDNDAYDEQSIKEGIFSIDKSLAAEIPVIVSVDKEFDGANHSHLIVITGVEKEGEELKGFYFNDPNGREAPRKDEYVYLDKFIEHWKKRGIFVIKK